VGVSDGDEVGAIDGRPLGAAVGLEDGDEVGTIVGSNVG
jgi:hypothetical protein